MYIIREIIYMNVMNQWINHLYTMVKKRKGKGEVIGKWKSRKISKYEILVLDLVLGHNGYLQKLEAGGGWMGAGHNLQLNFDQ